MKSKVLWLAVGAFLIAGSASPQAAQFGDFTYESSGTAVTITKYTGPGGAVTIPDAINGLPVTSIGDGTFSGCVNLTTLTIPSSVTTIEWDAFSGCISLSSIAIPNTVTNIRGGVFSGCMSLTAIEVDALNPVYSSLEGVLFNKSRTTLIQCPAGRTGTYAIPSTITSIGDGAFSDCTRLASVTIPNSVTSIGWDTFRGCASLIGVSIPSSVTAIGGQAFSGCTSLTSVVIPDSVTSFGDNAFSGCTELTTVAIGDGVTTIGHSAFRDCSRLTDVIIPTSVTSIGGEAFRGCANLTTVVIPDSIRTIGDGAFHGCTSLTEVTIPGSVTSIGYGAFSSCASLTRIAIPGSVITIGDYAFSYCRSLTSLTVGDGVTTIGPSAFRGCCGLTSVMIPNGVSTIGEWAFSWCSNLSAVRIGSGATRIGPEAFRGCTSLTSIEVDALNPNYSSLEGVLFNKNQTSLIQCPGSKAGSYTIPNSVGSIGDWAFAYCTSLDSVTIPKSVTLIEEVQVQFNGCSSLTAIDVDWLNLTYSSLEGVLFNKNLTALTLLPKGKAGGYTIPNSVTTIGSWAFAGCSSLTSVTIPNSVTHIGEGAFSDCRDLTSLYFEGMAPGVCPRSCGICVWSFEACPAVIIYYRAGTTGWGATFAGRPTALWIDPPVYSEWLRTTGLPTQYPQATAEADDPDQDGMSNYAEMLAGTDPTDCASLLTLERVPRPNDLTAEDQTAIDPSQHALYFRSVPGKSYGVQWADSIDGPWNTTAVVTASTTQERLVFDKPESKAFYRVILAQ